ncbi:MAG: penicillin acylase family protein [Ignavibacteriae bacterium]|nr:penicillin acylase family protein [Ignavibacteriota bacterium]
MSKLSKILFGGAVALLIIGIALFFFFYYLVTKSFPQTGGTIELPSLQKPVEIVHDEWGVPHISAQTEHDLMVAVGFVHAQNRLWQMELARRAGSGRLSELLDTATVKYDKLFRTLGFARLAEKLERNLHPDSRRLLEDYAEGINAYIQVNKGKYPVEFDMLNFEPEPWTVQHSLLVARLMAWELNFAWWTDLTYAEIASRVSPEKFQDIIPGTSESFPSTVSFSMLDESDVTDFLDVNRSYRNYFNLGNLSGASNAWVVGSEKSMSGKPLLANDPHLRVTAPNWWYEIHLTAPGWNVAGVSIPGSPFVIIGHNDSLAWGFTNAMLDDADFYIEREDSLKPYFYHYKNSLLPMEVREEIIKTKSGDSLTLTVRSTHHGPIINDVNLPIQHGDSIKKNPVAIRWTGYEMSDEFHGFYLMNRSTNITEFEHGLKELTVPGQTAVYADVEGNIAFWTAAAVPLRTKGNAMLPFEGWTGITEWEGFLPFEKLPHEINPSCGYIVCANHKLGDETYPYYLSTLWEPPSRYQRIEELLREAEKSSSEDFKLIQQDVFSYYHREICQHILSAFPDDSTTTTQIQAALEYLHNWDYRSTANDIATTIVNEFFVQLLHNTFDDELGSDVFSDFVFFSAIPYRVSSQLLAADSSRWFDNISTEQIETKNEILRLSFQQALDTLQELLGAEMKHWQWGNIHRVEFAHTFGARKPLDVIFNVGPFPVGGSATTINKGDYKLTRQFNVFSAPSMRQIVDLAQPARALMVNQLGQSGQPLHEHYDDQTPLWLNGGYRTVTLDWSVIRSAQMKRLELVPNIRE